MSLLNPRHLLAPLNNKTHLGIILGAVLVIGAFRLMAGTSVDREAYLEAESDYSQNYLAPEQSLEDSADREIAPPTEQRFPRGEVDAPQDYPPADDSAQAEPAPSGQLDLSDIEKEMGL